MHKIQTCIHTCTYTTDPKAILQRALQDGFIPHKDDLFLFHGPGGVGKSSLIAMLLGKQRKLIRDSTAVAEEPLHVCPARDVLNQTFTADWELVGNDRMSRMIAHTSHHLISSKRGGEQEKKSEETQAAEEGIETSTDAEKKSKIVEMDKQQKKKFSLPQLLQLKHFSLSQTQSQSILRKMHLPNFGLV